MSLCHASLSLYPMYLSVNGVACFFCAESVVYLRTDALDVAMARGLRGPGVERPFERTPPSGLTS